MAARDDLLIQSLLEAFRFKLFHPETKRFRIRYGKGRNYLLDYKNLLKLARRTFPRTYFKVKDDDFPRTIITDLNNPKSTLSLFITQGVHPPEEQAEEKIAQPEEVATSQETKKEKEKQQADKKEIASFKATGKEKSEWEKIEEEGSATRRTRLAQETQFKAAEAEGAATYRTRLATEKQGTGNVATQRTLTPITKDQMLKDPDYIQTQQTIERITNVLRRQYANQEISFQQFQDKFNQVRIRENYFFSHKYPHKATLYSQFDRALDLVKDWDRKYNPNQVAYLIGLRDKPPAAPTQPTISKPPTPVRRAGRKILVEASPTPSAPTFLSPRTVASPQTRLSSTSREPEAKSPSNEPPKVETRPVDNLPRGPQGRRLRREVLEPLSTAKPVNTVSAATSIPTTSPTIPRLTTSSNPITQTARQSVPPPILGQPKPIGETSPPITARSFLKENKDTSHDQTSSSQIPNEALQPRQWRGFEDNYVSGNNTGTGTGNGANNRDENYVSGQNTGTGGGRSASNRYSYVSGKNGGTGAGEAITSGAQDLASQAQIGGRRASYGASRALGGMGKNLLGGAGKGTGSLARLGASTATKALLANPYVAGGIAAAIIIILLLFLIIFGLNLMEKTSLLEAGKEHSLEISKSGPQSVANGQEITYTIDYSYKGSGTADGTITDIIPKNTQYVSSRPEGTLSQQEEDTTITWTFAKAAPNDRKTVYLTVKPTSNDIWVSNEATGKIDKVEGGTQKKENLTLRKTGPDHVENGQSIEYKLNITYTGRGKADIEITDQIPANTLVTNPGEGKIEGNTIKWNLEDIEPNKTQEFTYVLQPQVNDSWIVNKPQGKITKITGGSNDILPENLPPPPPNWEKIKSDILATLDSRPEVVATYQKASDLTGVPWEMLAGLHYVETNQNPNTNASLVSGKAIGDKEPDVKICSPNNTPGKPIPLPGGGCGFRTFEDTAIYAANHLIEKIGRVPLSFEDAVRALSEYNGGGNANCDEPVPYATAENCPNTRVNTRGQTVLAPVFKGEDDPYAMSQFGEKYANMYLIFCEDGKRCSPLRSFNTNGPSRNEYRAGSFAVIRALSER
jgi:uncharacterized repeat protein (TIGR01451 family)